MADTIQSERERDYAWQQLSAVFRAPERAYSIHYALQRLRREQTDLAPPVAAIALRNVGTGQGLVFSIKAEADAAGLDLSAALPAERMNALEYGLLFKLNDFLGQHADHLFVHWYMRDEKFGFQALEHRHRKVLADMMQHLHGSRSVAPAVAFGFGGGTSTFPLRVPDASKVDLALVLRHVYGIGPVGLRELASRNGLSHAELIEGVEEPEVFERGNHARLQWSSSTKARLVADLARFAYEGRLSLARAAVPVSARPASSAPRIFINYRREDTEAAANWLHELLSCELGEDNVFIDTDDIPAGIDFVEHLRRQIESCDVFLAMIGRRWATAADETGQLRLTDPDDFVRREIRAALKREIPVIPVLVESTPMPTELHLPIDLLALRRRQGVELRSRQFKDDVERLVAKIRETYRLRQAEVLERGAGRR